MTQPYDGGSTYFGHLPWFDALSLPSSESKNAIPPASQCCGLFLSQPQPPPRTIHCATARQGLIN